MSDSDLELLGRRRVGKGGVALLWHNRIYHIFTPLSFKDDRINGLQLEISPLNYVYLFQVYLPCSNYQMASFYDYLDKLSNLLGSYSDKGTVIIMGDLNTNILSNSSRIKNKRTRYMIDFWLAIILYPLIPWSFALVHPPQLCLMIVRTSLLFRLDHGRPNTR